MASDTTETVKVICQGCGRELYSQPYQASRETLRIDVVPCQHCLAAAEFKGACGMVPRCEGRADETA